MIEFLLTWQRAIRLRDNARTSNWTSSGIVGYVICEPKSIVLPMAHHLDLRSIRNWLHDNEINFVLYGLFNHGESPIPDFFRFVIRDDDDRALFSMLWTDQGA